VLLHRHLPATDVIAGLAAALEVGPTTTTDLVAVEAREAHQTRGGQTAAGPAVTEPEPPRAAGPQVASLTERRLGDPAAVIAGPAR